MDLWAQPFCSESVFGETDCIEYARAWLRAFHGVDYPRPGYMTSIERLPAWMAFVEWETHLAWCGFRHARTTQRADVLLLEKMHNAFVALRHQDDSYWLRTRRTLRPASGRVVARFIYSGSL